VETVEDPESKTTPQSTSVPPPSAPREQSFHPEQRIKNEERREHHDNAFKKETTPFGDIVVGTRQAEQGFRLSKPPLSSHTMPSLDGDARPTEVAPKGTSTHQGQSQEEQGMPLVFFSQGLPENGRDVVGATEMGTCHIIAQGLRGGKWRTKGDSKRPQLQHHRHCGSP
jgi:hypothetical protein